MRYIPKSIINEYSLLRLSFSYQLELDKKMEILDKMINIEKQYPNIK